MDTEGNLRVTVTGDSSGNPAAGPTGAAVPTDADYIGFSNAGGTLVGVSAANPLPVTGGSGGGAVTAVAGAFADGALVTEGTKADAAYAGSGSASIVALLKGLFATLIAPLPAGTNALGSVSVTGTTTITGTVTNTSAGLA